MKKYIFNTPLSPGFWFIILTILTSTNAFAGSRAPKATPQESMMIAAGFIFMTGIFPFIYHYKQRRKYLIGKQFIESMSESKTKEKIINSISGKEKIYNRSIKIYKIIFSVMLLFMLYYALEIRNDIYDVVELMLLPVIFLQLAFGAKMIFYLAKLNTGMENSDESIRNHFSENGLSGILSTLFGRSFSGMDSDFSSAMFTSRVTPIVCPACGGKINEENPDKCQYCGSVLNLPDRNTEIIE